MSALEFLNRTLMHRMTKSPTAVGRAFDEGRCPAWVQSRYQSCGKSAVYGYLCQQHHTIALRRLRDYLAPREIAWDYANTTQNMADQARRNLSDLDQWIAAAKAGRDNLTPALVGIREHVAAELARFEHRHPEVRTRQEDRA